MAMVSTHRVELTLVIAMLGLAGCGRATGRGVTGQKPDAGSTGTSQDAGLLTDGAGAIAKAPECIPSDASMPIRCGTAKGGRVAWGGAVTIERGSGAPPAPEGGTIVSGGYQLAAETRYGEVPPDEGTGHVGDMVKRSLYVDCDVAYGLYEIVSPDNGSMGTGNECHRLVPRSIPLIERTGWMVSKGSKLPAIPDSRDQVSYSAKGSHLTLIDVSPYTDHNSGAVLGSYTTVSELILVSDASASARTAPGEMQKPVAVEAAQGRESRCPAKPPENGDPCSPDPAPLECEYGGDAWKRCTTFARCELDPDGSFHFRIAHPTPCTPPNPPDCPPTFAAAAAVAASDGGAPAANGSDAGPLPLDHGCNYDEGVCGCVYQGSMPDQAHCYWSCKNGANVGKNMSAGCPWPRPLAGDACNEGLECKYQTTCNGNATIGPSMVCQNSHWATFGGLWFGCGP